MVRRKASRPESTEAATDYDTSHSLAARGVVTAQHSISSALTRSVAILVACLVVALALAVAIGLWRAHTIVRPLQSLIALLGNAEHLRVVS
jgi:hypothetical protein